MAAQHPGGGLSLRAFAPVLLLDIVCPYLTYQYLQRHAPAMSQTFALVAVGRLPGPRERDQHRAEPVARHRRCDRAARDRVGVVAALLGGGPRLVLVRESFVTGAVALVCLASLAAPRPLLFYIGRDFSTGHDPARIAEFNALWHRPGAPHVFRVMTAVWGIGWLAEVALKALIVFTLPIPRALVVGPIESGAITVLLILWTVRYARAARRRGEARAAAAGSSASPRSRRRRRRRAGSGDQQPRAAHREPLAHVGGVIAHPRGDPARGRRVAALHDDRVLDGFDRVLASEQLARVRAEGPAARGGIVFGSVAGVVQRVHIEIEAGLDDVRKLPRAVDPGPAAVARDERDPGGGVGARETRIAVEMAVTEHERDSPPGRGVQGQAGDDSVIGPEHPPKRVGLVYLDNIPRRACRCR